jgi:hypothetical protein
MESRMRKIFTIIALCILLTVFSSYSFAETDYETALSFYDNGQYMQAIIMMKSHVEEKPEPAAYYLIGYSFYKLDNFDEANKYEKPKAVTEAAAAPAERAPEPAATPAPPPAEKAPEEAPPPEPAPEVKPKKLTEAAPEKPKWALPPGGIVALLLSSVLTLGIALGIYLFSSLCMFLIARKLNVSKAWLAWVPIIQIWTFIKSADKAWWWILLLLVPVANFFVGIYLWMCITENLGKNKLLGLLMLVPVLNFLFPAYLAFSKSAGSGLSMEDSIPDIDLTGTPDLGLSADLEAAIEEKPREAIEPEMPEPEPFPEEPTSEPEPFPEEPTSEPEPFLEEPTSEPESFPEEPPPEPEPFPEEEPPTSEPEPFPEEEPPTSEPDFSEPEPSTEGEEDFSFEVPESLFDEELPEEEPPEEEPK